MWLVSAVVVIAEFVILCLTRFILCKLQIRFHLKVGICGNTGLVKCGLSDAEPHD
jgi:hypothetical protein